MYLKKRPVEVTRPKKAAKDSNKPKYNVSLVSGPE